MGPGPREGGSLVHRGLCGLLYCYWATARGDGGDEERPALHRWAQARSAWPRSLTRSVSGIKLSTVPSLRSVSGNGSVRIHWAGDRPGATDRSAGGAVATQWGAVRRRKALGGTHRTPQVTRPYRARDSLGAGPAMCPATSAIVGVASAATRARAIQWGTITEVAVPTARSGRADPSAMSVSNVLAPHASRKARAFAPTARSARRRGLQSLRWSCNSMRPGTSAATASRSAGVLL
mmetsp:Transcript_18629/g.40165  ORF Transcript_18629/g.40165 Transcript_18629/m.40165 type:complete len:235 (-) Transcript_18629:230-934(-)